jgi:hypothetical protein
LLNARSQGLWGVDAMSTEDVKHWFSIPTLDPAEDMRIAVATSGELVAYADVNKRRPGAHTFLDRHAAGAGCERGSRRRAGRGDGGPRAEAGRA